MGTPAYKFRRLIREAQAAAAIDDAERQADELRALIESGAIRIEFIDPDLSEMDDGVTLQ